MLANELWDESMSAMNGLRVTGRLYAYEENVNVIPVTNVSKAVSFWVGAVLTGEPERTVRGSYVGTAAFGCPPGGARLLAQQRDCDGKKPSGASLRGQPKAAVPT